jgi:hypothetical protein
VIEVDPKSLVAEVGVGERLDRLEAALLARGTTLGPLSGADAPLPPAAATLGDALRARAGRLAPRYGELWDRVLSVEALFPRGRVLVTKGVPRAATGPDIARTVLEARGQLGEIRKVWLRLRPAPQRRDVVRARAAALAAGLDALGALFRAGLLPGEVALEASAEGAILRVALEGEVLVVDAERKVLERAWAILGVECTPEPSSRGALERVRDLDPANGTLVERLWSEWPGALKLLGEEGAAAANVRLVAARHEGATLEIRGLVGEVEMSPTGAERTLAQIADALARRCA